MRDAVSPKSRCDLPLPLPLPLPLLVLVLLLRDVRVVQGKGQGPVRW